MSQFVAIYSYSLVRFLLDDRTVKLVDSSKRHISALQIFHFIYVLQANYYIYKLNRSFTKQLSKRYTICPKFTSQFNFRRFIDYRLNYNKPVNISVNMKSARGKQNNIASSNQFVSSTYRVEADQKEIIIKALKSDYDNLRKNQTDYHKLHDQYKQLQHKYKILNDQKTNEERDFKMRHDAAIRNITQLKNQIDALRAELRDKKLQINDLQSDQTALKQQLDERNIELQNFRNDYKACVADSNELAGQKQNLNNAANKLKAIISQIQEQDQLLKEDNDSVNRRLQELERYQQQLLLQQKILKQKIQIYENENNELDNSINQLNQHLADLELAIKKAQDELTQLQQSVAEINLLNEKYKTENIHTQKNIQAEVTKNNNFAKTLKNTEYTRKIRSGQVEEGDREIANLKEEKESLTTINNKLAEDLQACRNHLQNLGLINIKLVQHLQNFSAQDQTIRDLLNRKSRVDICRGRVNQVQSSVSNPSNDRFNETRVSGRSYA